MAKVFPVIHHIRRDLSIQQAALAFRCGADGVFVISHHDKDMDVVDVAKAIKSSHGSKHVGINLLNHTGQFAIEQATAARLDSVWDDSPGVRSDGISTEAQQLTAILQEHPRLQFFGSVAFKYQPIDPSPEKAAIHAIAAKMVPTTSGSGTGRAPDLDKILRMRQAIDIHGDHLPLAIASGMTLENVEAFAPYLSHILVATGVSVDEYHFCEKTLRAFISKVNEQRGKA